MKNRMHFEHIRPMNVRQLLQKYLNLRYLRQIITPNVLNVESVKARIQKIEISSHIMLIVIRNQYRIMQDLKTMILLEGLYMQNAYISFIEKKTMKNKMKFVNRCGTNGWECWTASENNRSKVEAFSVGT